MEASGTAGGSTRSKVNKGKRHQRDLFHSQIVDGAFFAGPMDMPMMTPVNVTPKGLVPFSVAMQSSCEDFDQFVDFYEDDYEFERFWNSPHRYIDRLLRFAGAVSPDFSTCWDFPVAMKAWNTYRNKHWATSFKAADRPASPMFAASRINHGCSMASHIRAPLP